mmetsp:Transcript_113639/g.367184  ORF Transcript_113639/g.367184 Transcript_113639/m.367184 type:complete len:228 (+) Transcript_113639:449-1132(+)
MECQFSGGEPWKAKVEPCCCFSFWNCASRSGAAVTSRYCHSVPKSEMRCSTRRGSRKQRMDCTIHWIIGRTSSLRRRMRSVHETQEAPSTLASFRTASTSRISLSKACMQLGVSDESAGLLSPSTKSLGNGSKMTLRRADFAAWTAMQTRRSVTSAVVFMPSASVMSWPNCENFQQQNSRPQTVRWIMGGDVCGSSHMAQYSCNVGSRKKAYRSNCATSPSSWLTAD